MSTMSQFFGGGGGGVPGVPSSIVNAQSSGTPAGIPLPGNFTLYNATILNPGALTANTLKTALSISGKGRLSFVGVRTGDATSRTLRLKITLDGVVAFDSTSSAITTFSHGILAIGSLTIAGANYWPIPSDVYFNNSALVEVASSLTETSLVNVPVMYEVYQ